MSSDLDNWAKKYEDLTNSDETIAAMAKYYSCSFMFDMEKAKIIIDMHDGKVKNINTNPGPLDAYDFALRASANTWKEFSQPMPKPMYHGIWSASFRKDLKIEGNHLILMKNLRNFTVQFELLRNCLLYTSPSPRD